MIFWSFFYETWGSFNDSREFSFNKAPRSAASVLTGSSSCARALDTDDLVPYLPLYLSPDMMLYHLAVALPSAYWPALSAVQSTLAMAKFISAVHSKIVALHCKIVIFYECLFILELFGMTWYPLQSWSTHSTYDQNIPIPLAQKGVNSASTWWAWMVSTEGRGQHKCTMTIYL